MMRKVSKVQMVLQTILEKFKTGDIPKAIAYSMFPIPKTPSDSWSYLNRLIMFLSGTYDARGIRQWNSVGRSVKRGAKAIYILVPYFVKGKNVEDHEEEILKGFMASPVFKVQDTEGEHLDYIQDIPVPDLPLMERAKELGIKISTELPCYGFYGVYIANKKEILIASPEEIVFFHELSHAAYEFCIDKLKPSNNWIQEVIAELSAQALCHLVGKQPNNNLGNSYHYIESYAASEGLKPVTACLKVINDVETILNFILGKEVKKYVERSITRAA